MANKNKNFDQKSSNETMELLYMTPSEIKAKDIAQFLQGTNGLRVELWDEMNVFELELLSQNTVDFEPLDTNFSEPSDASFIRNRNIHTIFAVSLSEIDFPIAKPYLEQIVEQFSGFLCADSEDFSPVYVGSSTK